MYTITLQFPALMHWIRIYRLSKPLWKQSWVRSGKSSKIILRFILTFIQKITGSERHKENNQQICKSSQDSSRYYITCSRKER
jgi:hypothetical protein